MSQSRRTRGRASEEAVAKYLRANGFPAAERRAASLPGSDVVGIPSVDVEVKARRDLSLTALMAQQSKRAAAADVVPIGVVRPDGWGPARVADWPTVMPLHVAVALLRAAGHGDPVMPAGLVMRRPPTTPPAPTEAVADWMRCHCGTPELLDVTHTSAGCHGPEQDGVFG